jgi:hypothetical protein
MNVVILVFDEFLLLELHIDESGRNGILHVSIQLISFFWLLFLFLLSVLSFKVKDLFTVLNDVWQDCFAVFWFTWQ